MSETSGSMSIEDARTLFMEVGGGAPDVMKKYMATGELPPMNHNPKFEIINPRLAITTAVRSPAAVSCAAWCPRRTQPRGMHSCWLRCR
mgnify:CR=1 FL=1